jgi:imidazolonepropionase-like amidohydrolase
MAGPGFFADPRTWQVSQGLEPGGLPWMKAIDSASDIPTDVTLARGTSAVAVKIYADLPSDLIERITAEAQRQGLLVWAHAAVFPTRPSQVVAAGVDSISHAQMLGYELAGDGELSTYAGKRPAMPTVPAGNPVPEIAGLFAQMRERGTILDATVSMWTSVETVGRPTREADRRAAVGLTAQAHRAGVDISTGTDYETPAADPYPSLHRELLFLAEEVGMSPIQVLRSATLVGARALGQQDVMGTIEPGKLANLLVLNADPTADIRNIGRIEFVLKRGRRFCRDDRPAGGARTSDAAPKG